MALKEGRCYNCGSILMLDPQQEKGHCIYCDAVFDNKLAFEIATNPQGYEFKNEKMEKYTGPNLDPTSQTGAIDEDALHAAIDHNAAKRALKQQDSVGKPNLSEESIPELKASKKAVLITILGIVIFFGLFFAIAIPKINHREEVRKQLTANFIDAEKLPLTYGENLLIRGGANDTVVMAFKEKPEEDTVRSYWETYAQERAKLLDLEGDAKYKGLEMEVISADGGYLLTWTPENKLSVEPIQ
ncbi:MAG: hypothetical protein Q4E09_01055 [Eubacteriales bacterium]|nr:hypothetical protein [Eubacteriales bacterium]